MCSDLPAIRDTVSGSLETTSKAIVRTGFRATPAILFLIALAHGSGKIRGQSTTENSTRQAPPTDVIDGIRETIRAIEPVEDTSRLSRLISRCNATELADADLYALLLEIEEESIRQLNFRQYVSHCDLRVDQFGLDPFRTYAANLKGLSKRHPGEFAKAGMIKKTAQILERRSDTTSLDDLIQLAKEVLANSSNSQSLELDELKQVLQACVLQDGQDKAYEKAKQVLEDNPEDPEANYVVGAWIVVRTGDWQNAIRHFRKCHVDSIAQAASLESSGGDSFAVAGLWQKASGGLKKGHALRFEILKHVHPMLVTAAENSESSFKKETILAEVKKIESEANASRKLLESKSPPQVSNVRTSVENWKGVVFLDSGVIETQLRIEADEAITIEFFCAPVAEASDGVVLGNAGKGGFELAVVDQHWCFSWYDRAGRKQLRSRLAVAPLQLTHVAVTLNDGIAKLFIDGNVDDIESFDGHSASPAAVSIGARRIRESEYRDYFSGFLTNLHITKTAKYNENFVPDNALEPGPQSILFLKFRKHATQEVFDISRQQISCAMVGGRVVAQKPDFLSLVQSESNSAFARFAVVKPNEQAYRIGTLVPNENIYRGKGFPITDIPREVQRWRFVKFWMDRPLQLMIHVNQPGIVRIMTFAGDSQLADSGWRRVCVVREKKRYGWSVLEKHFSAGSHLIPILHGRTGSRLLFQ